MKFLSNLLAVLLGLFIFTFLVFLFFVIIIAASSAEKPVKVSENTVLHIELNGVFVEQEANDPFADLNFPTDLPREIGIKELKEVIRHATNDSNINGIFLEPKFFDAGYASLEEVRDELVDFKSTGKFIVSYSEMYTEKGYYLAAVSDEIWLTPNYGMIEFNGINYEMVFIKGTLEKLGVEPQVFRVGDYKSAVEPFLLDKMSEENRVQIKSYVNSIYGQFIHDVAESRGLATEEVRNISDSMLVRFPEDAIRLKLATVLGYQSQVEDSIKSRLGQVSGKKLRKISYRDYKKTIPESEYANDRIAVIVASGSIMTGKGDDQSVGSDRFVQEIRKARNNDKVKAIVLRINSPGGSALASDIIWEEIELAKKEKPVIASMSDVAASGGYYIAMGCDTIVANPTTITGSIGVFGMLFNAQKLLSNKLGVTTDNVNTGHFSDMYNMTRPLTGYEKQIFQGMVDRIYEVFTGKAAEGRNMPVEDLLKIASGRVWSGQEALDNGLVDVLGSLEDAINIAAEKAGVEDYKVVYYPQRKSFLEELFSSLADDTGEAFLRSRTGELYPYIEQVKKSGEYYGIQARLPYELKID